MATRLEILMEGRRRGVLNPAQETELRAAAQAEATRRGISAEPPPQEVSAPPARLDPFSPEAMLQARGLPDTPRIDPFERGAGDLKQAAGRVAGSLTESVTPENLVRLGSVIGSALNRGGAQLAGAPVELMNRVPQLANLLPGEQGVGPISDQPVGGINTMESIINALGLNPVPRSALNTPLERVIGRTGEEIGAGALVSGGLLAKAARGARAVSPTGRGLENVFVEPFRRAPGTALATETALATGAGTGAGVVGEIPGVEPGSLGDLLGAAVGTLGAGGALSVGRATGRLGQNVAEAAGGVAGLGPQNTRSTRLGVGEMLTRRADDPQGLPARIAEGQAIAQDIPGLQPTAATAANDPVLQALEFQRQSGPGAGTFRARTAENQAAIDEALRGAEPSAQTDIATRERLAQRQAQTEGALERGTARRQEAVETAQERVAPAQTRSEAGRDVRAETEAQLERLRLTREEASNPSLQTALRSEVEVDANPVLQAIDDKLRTVKREAVVNALRNARTKLFKNEAAGGGVDDTVAGLFEARKAINDLIAGRTEDSTGRFAQKELREIRGVLDEAITGAEPTFGKFLSTFREESIPIGQLEEGATGAVLKKAKLTGRPDIPESEVPRQFFRAKNGSPEAIEEFVGKVGTRDKAVEGVRQFALNDAKDVFEKGGDKALTKWIKDHEDALGAFPETRRDLSDLAGVKKVLDRAARREKMIKAGLNNPRQSTIAAYLDPTEAATSMRQVLSGNNSAQKMNQLMRQIRGDKDAIEGAKRAFFDLFSADDPGKALGAIRNAAEDLNGASLISAGKLKKFMRKFNPALRALYQDDPAQLDRINRIATGIQRGTSVSRARPPGTSGTPLATRETPLFALNTALSRAFNVQKGVVSPRFVLTEAALRIGRKVVIRVKKREFEELLDRALLEPEVAKTLVMEFNAQNSKIIARRMRLFLGRDVGEALRQDEEK